MKKLLMAIVACALLIPVLALAEGPVLLVELPEDAQMIENVQFEDGDFIQTYQTGSGTVQLLRYGSFEMSLDLLTEGEWSGYTNMRQVELPGLSGQNAEGMRFLWEQVDESVDVTLVLVHAQGQELLFQALYPTQVGQEAIDAAVQGMLNSLSLLTDAPQEEAEVG